MGTNLRSAAIQALEALEWAWGGEPLTGKEMVAIAALRVALAEPEQEQEPVALDYGSTEFGFTFTVLPLTDGDKRLAALLTQALGNDHPAFQDLVALFFAARGRAPTPRKPLTDEELEPLCDAVNSYDITQYDLFKFARAIERAHGIGDSNE